MMRRVWLLTAAVVCLTAAGNWFWRERITAPPHVVIIDIDCLRAQALHAYGYPEEYAPTITGLLRQGTLFEYAYTPFPHTVPSHAALFTGLLPGNNGVKEIVPVPPEQTLLSERLQEAGYRTAAFVSGWTVTRQYGFNRGFVHFDDALPGSGDMRAGEQTVTALAQWLERSPHIDRPLFLWLHLFDMHAPYALAVTSEDSYTAYVVEQATAPFPGKFVPLYLKKWYERFPSLDAAAQEYYRALAYVDGQVARTLALLRRHGLLDNAVLIFLADHGEGLGERGYYFDHGERVDEEQIRVPLALVAPGRVPAGGGETRNVRLPDVMPTVLELCGVPYDAGTLDGRSLLPLLREPRARDERMVYVEGGVYRPFMSYPTDLRGEASRPRALLFGEYKYLQYAGRQPELYHIRRDPEQQQNLADSEPERAVTMRLLLELYRDHGRVAARRRNDDRDAAPLRALGYLQ